MTVAQNWIVYRDGAALQVLAVGAYEATCLTRDAEVLPLLKRLAPREPSTGRGPGPEDADYAFAARVRDGFEIVRDEGTHGCAVYFAESISLCTALECWRAAFAQHERARRLKPLLIVVPCYRSGKREGQLKFTRAHSKEYRARVVEDVLRNARRAAAIEDASDALAVSGEVVNIAAAFDGEVLQEHAARVRKILAERPRELARLLGPLALANLTARLSAALSVEQHGFAPGARVQLLPDPGAHEDEPDYSGPETIEIAHPIETGRFADYHSREVQLDDGRLISTSLSKLRPLEDHRKQVEIFSCTPPKPG